MTQNPCGQVLVITEASRSRSDTPHSDTPHSDTSNSDTPHSVRRLWTSDRPVAEKST
jgi:hypothetical protein